MKKKRYEAPVVQKIKLSVGEAILATCHSSPNLTPKIGIAPCSIDAGCFTPPLGA